MEIQCSDVQSFLVPDDAIITDDSTIQVLRDDDDVILTEEAALVEDVDGHDATGSQQLVAENVEVDTTMMAFVKFVQQSDGTLAPVGLVPAEEIEGEAVLFSYCIT